MPWVEFAEPPSVKSPRLARATSRPDGTVVRPSAQSKSVGPSADPREKVCLRVAIKVGALMSSRSQAAAYGSCSL
jgi:hypothetical protein